MEKEYQAHIIIAVDYLVPDSEKIVKNFSEPHYFSWFATKEEHANRLRNLEEQGARVVHVLHFDTLDDASNCLGKVEQACDEASARKERQSKLIDRINQILGEK